MSPGILSSQAFTRSYWFCRDPIKWGGYKHEVGMLRIVLLVICKELSSNSRTCTAIIANGKSTESAVGSASYHFKTIPTLLNAFQPSHYFLPLYDLCTHYRRGMTCVVVASTGYTRHLITVEAKEEDVIIRNFY